MFKNFYYILISILLINILKVNSEKLFDNILSQFSLFTFGEQKLTVNNIPGRIAAKSNINLSYVSNIGNSLFSVPKTCDALDGNYKYTIVTNGYVKTDTQTSVFNGNIASSSVNSESQSFNHYKNCGHIVQKDVIDWDEYKDAVTYISNTLANLDDTQSGQVYNDNYNGLVVTFGLSNGVSKYVMNFGSILSISNFNYCNSNINTDNVDVNSVTIVFNFSDENVYRFISFDNLRNYASRVIYNFALKFV